MPLALLVAIQVRPYRTDGLVANDCFHIQSSPRRRVCGNKISLGQSNLLKDSCRDMLEQQVKKADMRAVFTEYDPYMNWCDPCAADPLTFEELRSLGVFRLNETPPELIPGRGRRSIMPPMDGARDVFVTSKRAPDRQSDRMEDRRYPKSDELPTVGDAKRWQNLCTRLPAAA